MTFDGANGPVSATTLSAANQRIKRLRRLSGRRSSRLDDGAFVVEGPVLVREALAVGLDVEAVYVDVGEGALVAEFDNLGVPVMTVAAGVLGSVLPAVSPQPVCAVVATTLVIPVADVAARAVAVGRPVVVLVDVADPGNVGTLVRAAEASGACGVIVAGRGVDLYNPKVVRSSAGSLFRLALAAEPDPVAVLDALAGAGVPTIAAVARGGVGHLDPSLDRTLGGAVGVVLGNEAHGLSDDVVELCDEQVTISMDGPAESLNVAMAGTVLCFEALRRRS